MSLRVVAAHREAIDRLLAAIGAVIARRVERRERVDEGEEVIERRCLECGAFAVGPEYRGDPEIRHAVADCSVGVCEAAQVMVLPSAPQLHREAWLLEKAARHVPSAAPGPEEKVRAAAAILLLVDAEVLR